MFFFYFQLVGEVSELNYEFMTNPITQFVEMLTVQKDDLEMMLQFMQSYRELHQISNKI
jgi:hypothetical protein